MISDGRMEINVESALEERGGGGGGIIGNQPEMTVLKLKNNKRNLSTGVLRDSECK